MVFYCRFNHVGLKNIGSGLFGFFVGIWTVVFFVISVPLLEILSVSQQFYTYSVVLFLIGLWPLLTISDIQTVVTITNIPSTTINENINTIENNNNNNINNATINNILSKQMVTLADIKARSSKLTITSDNNYIEEID